MADDSLDSVTKVWKKISDTVSKGLKTGKDEIVRTTRMGSIRLEISSIKSQIENKQKELGKDLYNLWKKEAIDIADLEGQLLAIKQLDEHILEKEHEIAKIVEEKEHDKEARAKESEAEAKAKESVAEVTIQAQEFSVEVEETEIPIDTEKTIEVEAETEEIVTGEEHSAEASKEELLADKTEDSTDTEDKQDLAK